MGILDLLKGIDINTGVNRYQETENAILIDVRDRSEYEAGHIPGSKNLPLADIDRIPEIVREKDMAVFTYCLSGRRSGNAVSALKAKGYTNVTNIGGINGYKGPLEK